MKNIEKFIKELVPYIVIIMVVVIFRIWIATPVRVDGDSMNPTLENNQILILNKMNHKYKKNDIIVFKYNGSKLVKRIVATPKDKVKISDGVLYVNGKKLKDVVDTKIEYSGIAENEITVNDDEYFVLGDNRNNSLDSRYIGLISKNEIEGTVAFSIFPPKKIK